MHLKTLTLRGFKSFASATKLEFEPGITCVVGPNGSGKSNVVDALAWVMGEQGAKNLRGGKMEDVIFAGTAKKQALGRAEVALTIDNSDGALPIDYTEVTISRTLFRSGGSEYRVNGEPARLLDIQELLSDSGLGKEMHVIVGQGRLDAILHADPFERRGFIEEAAGVLKHRKRKEKALRKLTGLQTNLDRLADLRSELARQLGPLGRQAKAAQRAQVVQAVVRDATARLLADDLVQLQARIAATTPDYDPAERRRAIEEEVRLLDEEIGEAETARRTFDAHTDEAHNRRTAIAAQHSRATALAQRAGDRVTMLRAAAEQHRPVGESPDALRERAERFVADHDEAQEEAADRRTALDDLTAEKEDVESRLSAAERELAGERARIAARVKHRAELESGVAVAERTMSHAESVISSLDAESAGSDEQIVRAEVAVAEARERLTASESGETVLDESHTAAAARVAEVEEQRTALVQAREQEKAELVSLRAQAEGQRASSRLTAELSDLVEAGLPGLRGAVAQHLRIVPGCEVAVTAAIGTLSGAVLAADQTAALALLDHVGEDRLIDVVHPPATLASSEHPSHTSSAPPAQSSSPVSAEQPSESPSPRSSTPPAPAETVAAEAVVTSSAPDLAAALAPLLSGVRLAGSRETALARLSTHPDETVIALDGTVFAAGRAARAGSPEAGQIAARAALDDTLAAVEDSEARVAQLDRRIGQLDEPLAAARTQEKEAMAALHDSDAAIMAAGEELARAAGELERLTARASAAASSLVQATERRDAAAAELEGARRALADADAEEDLQDEPDTTERDRLADARSALGERTVDARVGLRTAEDRVTFLADRVRSLRRQADQEEAARAQAERTAQARRRQADGAEEIARIAAEVADRAGEWQREAEAALAERAGERQRLEEAVTGLRTRRADAADRLSRAADAEHAARLARERHLLQLEELERRAVDDVGLEADNLIEQFGPYLPVPVLDPREHDGSADGEDTPSVPYVRADVEKSLAKAKKELASIGQVNPLALEEFAALQERHDYLEKQITDVERTRTELLGLVEDVDRHVQEVFESAFFDTQREFADIFSRVFPGGEGSLDLTDPDDMLTTGVEVSARPAGKRVKRLSLLSGGERSLVAVAMLVAIFKARPSPFYVMDEVEAALDDVNLSRLLTIFRELQESSQLIVITHQKRTMEIADALYGVTMHGDGISRVISQRLESPKDAQPPTAPQPAAR
ncbi:chromosome segregation protein SMC [Brevibacterium yomogidense]|uniref:chromosome segregation protein SMC n=1 Tax=Brevibacterium yomogidense TaxID=946573 RepID=UPI0018DF30EE|nr:chromosome segregation protein SMC [Brevibacterium yomogidense]